MIKVLLLLFYEFFKTGLFAIGGGLATIPFLYDIAEKYDWLDASRLPDMIAIAESTPGPIGINLSTYAGYNAAGIAGAAVATLSLVLPSFIVVLIVGLLITRFHENRFVSGALMTVRPVSAAMVTYVAFTMMCAAIIPGGVFSLTLEYFSGISPISVAALAVFTFFVIKFKKHPVIYIAAGAVFGIGMGYAGLL